MFANLQGALGGSGATPLPGSSRGPRRSKVEEPAESLDDLDSIITQISDLSVRPDRSAAQISEYSFLEQKKWPFRKKYRCFIVFVENGRGRMG